MFLLGDLWFFSACFGTEQCWDVSALPGSWSRTLSWEMGLNVRDLAKNFLVEIVILQSRTQGTSQEANSDICMAFGWEHCKPWDSDLSKQQRKAQLIWLVSLALPWTFYQYVQHRLKDHSSKLWVSLGKSPVISTHGDSSQALAPGQGNPYPSSSINVVSNFLQDTHSRYECIDGKTYSCSWKGPRKLLPISSVTGTRTCFFPLFELYS